MRRGTFEADIDAGFLRVRLLVGGKTIHLSFDYNDVTVSRSRGGGDGQSLVVSGPNSNSGETTEFGLRDGLFGGL